jgi:hypothetical protein
MGELVILRNEFVTLKYHEDTKIVHHEFHQYVFGEPFRECLLKGLEVMKAHSAIKWLSDDKKNVAIPREEREWMNSEWSDRAFKAGWKYWAIVLPSKAIGKMAMNRILQIPKLAQQLTINSFNEVDAAYEWLVRQ